MSSIACRPNPADWRTLYRAAISETNQNLVAQRVLEAEQAALAREHEIFCGDSDSEERECLEDALYALRAYKNARRNSEAA